MTTINTIEDLVRLLDEKPEWAEALRTRILTRELIELPVKVERFRAEMYEAMAQTNQRVGRVEEQLVIMNQRLDSFTLDTDRRFLDIDRRFEEAAADRREIRIELGGLRSQLNGLRNDIGPIKAAHVRNAVREEVHDIARAVQCTFVRILDREQVYGLLQGQDTVGISGNELTSFRYADLIIEATDSQGALCYLAVEVSFTADSRDTARAVRNAGFLNRFTGRPAFAGVAGVRFDDEISSGVDGVFLYHVHERSLEVD